MALSYRARRRWALVILLVGLPLYVIAAVNLVALFERPSVLVELAVYVGLGVLWALWKLVRLGMVVAVAVLLLGIVAFVGWTILAS